MATASFNEMKKQASFFFREKFKTARLALTDVTPTELLTEEAVSGNPDARTLTLISKAAFELDDYSRIVSILHKRFVKFEKKNWRVCYNSLIIVEYLLTHGPESVAEEFQADKQVIAQMGSFQFVDEKGFNWGITVRRKSERILKLLENGNLLKEERERARKLTREIKGFGSFSSLKSSSSYVGKYGKCNSNFNREEENEVMLGKEMGKNQGFEETQGIEMPESGNKNLVPNIIEGFGEANPLLEGKSEDFKDGNSTYHSHPFNDVGIQTTASLLSV